MLAMKRQHSLQRKTESVGGVDDNDTDEKDDTKRKFRNLSEKKRRDEFNILVNELSTLLSTPTRKMDKTTVLKSTIAFLKNHNEISARQSECIDENWKPSFLGHEEFTHLMLEALDAFILVFSATTGKIIYMSETVTSLLGYPTNNFNMSIFELIHDGDQSDLYDLLHGENILSEITISLHMKHGPIHTPNISGFEVIRLIGSFYNWNLPESSVADADSCSSGAFSDESHLYFISLARFCIPQLLLEMTLSNGVKKEFASKHSLEWKFLFLDHRASPIIGYLPFEVLGTSGYDYYHVDDLEKVAASHEMLMQTGEGTSCFYRFLTKGQQWIWLQTRYYITYHQWNSKPEFVVCTHTVFSYEEVESSQKRSTSKDEVSGTQDTSDSVTSFSVDHRSPSVVSSQHSDISSVSSTVHLHHLDCPAASSRQEFTCVEPVSVMRPDVTLSSPLITEANPATIMGEASTSSQIPDYHQYLQWRHQQLQQQIMMQQAELRHVSEQLLSGQFVPPAGNILPTASSTMPVAANEDSNNEEQRS